VGRVCAAVFELSVGNTTLAGETHTMQILIPTPARDICNTFSIGVAKFTLRYFTSRAVTIRLLDDFNAGYSGSCGITYLTSS